MIELEQWQFWLLVLLAAPGVLLAAFMGWAGFQVGTILWDKKK
jgi:hypothetical protein